MNSKVLMCIPSLTLRSYIQSHPITLSRMQEATIVAEFGSTEEKLLLLKEFADLSDNETEKTLFLSARDDFQKYGYIDEKTNQIYRDSELSKQGSDPRYPFEEYCGLPVLFHVGDIITRDRVNYVIEYTPFSIEPASNFGGECYLCYPLDKVYKCKKDLYAAHEHFHVCTVEASSADQLTREQKGSLESVKRILNI